VPVYELCVDNDLIHGALSCSFTFVGFFFWSSKGKICGFESKIYARMMQVRKSSTVIAQNSQGVASFARSGMRVCRVPRAIKKQENGIDRLMVR